MTKRLTPSAVRARKGLWVQMSVAFTSQGVRGGRPRGYDAHGRNVDFRHSVMLILYDGNRRT